MVRRRRRMELSDASRWLSFVDRDWPGRCVGERFFAWRDAAWAAYRADSSLNSLEILRATYVEKRRVFSAHDECGFCLPLVTGRQSR